MSRAFRCSHRPAVGQWQSLVIGIRDVRNGVNWRIHVAIGKTVPFYVSFTKPVQVTIVSDVERDTLFSNTASPCCLSSELVTPGRNGTRIRSITIKNRDQKRIGRWGFSRRSLKCLVPSGNGHTMLYTVAGSSHPMSLNVSRLLSAGRQLLNPVSCSCRDTFLDTAMQANRSREME